MEHIYQCPQCGETKNLHYNYDYTKQHRPVREVLCNKCGHMFDGDIPIAELTKQVKIAPSEISDEEIADAANQAFLRIDDRSNFFIMGAQWYREQLKKRL